MITLDQVLMLENKVESAVARIQQLQAENDALRSKCAELTNALSSKSEQLSSFESNQTQIESGILNALDRLNQIENSVLKVTGSSVISELKQPEIITQAVSNPTFAEIPVQNSQVTIQESLHEEPAKQPQINSVEHSSVHPSVEQNYFQVTQQTVSNNSINLSQQSEIVEENVNFNSMEPLMAQQDDYPSDQDFGTPEEDFDSPDEPQDNLGFDIF